MPLIGINPVSSDPRKPSTLEQIAAGVQIATNILGTGLDAYKTFKVDIPKGKADADESKARAELYKTQAADYAGDKELDRELKRSQIEANRAMGPYKIANERLDFAKKSKELQNLTGLKPLPPDQIDRLSEAQAIPAMLSNIKQVIRDNKELFGPAKGRLGAMNPYDTKAQLVNAELESTAQIVGKYLEDGVLRKEDMPKYKKMLAQLEDTPDVAIGKPDKVLEKVLAKHNKRVEGLRQAGYDTSKFEDIINNPQAVVEAVRPGGMSPGTVMDGYKFLGGNPADPKSWEPVR